MLLPAAGDAIWGVPTALVDGLLGAIIGALIGGTLTVVGGYLAASYTLGQEKKSKQQDALEDLAAATRVVRYELATNATTIDGWLQRGQGKLTHDLVDTQFKSVQLLMARRLPQKLRIQLVHAYTMLPFATGNIAFLESGTSSDPQKAKGVIASVRDDQSNACEALRLYLVNDLKVPEA